MKGMQTSDKSKKILYGGYGVVPNNDEIPIEKEEEEDKFYQINKKRIRV